MKRRTNRVAVTVTREMTIALEMLGSKSGLPVSTQAMVVLRQALDRTIASEPVQIRLKQEEAFRTRNDWLTDRMNETFMTNAIAAAEGTADDAPPK